MALPAPISTLAYQAGRVAQSAGRTAAVYAALVAVGLTGAGFLVAAAFIWLAAQTSPLIASLIMAAVFLVTAAIWWTALAARNKRIMQERRVNTANTALMASSLALADAGLRLVSRARGPMFWPAAATLFATWYLTQNNRRDD